jgi:hypothetical protein
VIGNVLKKPFGQAVSEEKIFLTLANQKKELILAAMFVRQMERNKMYIYNVYEPICHASL